MSELTHDEFCAAAGAEIERFASLVQGADLGRPVPTCPEWDLAELIRHTGSVHRWATAMVRDLAPERLRRDQLELDLPADDAGLADWLAAGAGPLIEAFRAADPDAPMWAWGADHHVRFWPRRMVHETTVHRADAEFALGHQPAVDPALAADGIEELLDNLPSAAYFAPAVEKLRGQGETLHLLATEGASWLVHLEPEGFRWERGSGSATATVQGASSDLLLLLYGRHQADDRRFVCSGDQAVLDDWLAHSSL